MRLRLDVAIRLAEEHVVRAHFADFQRVVTVGRIAPADDQLRRVLLDRLTQHFRIAGNVQAVGLGTSGHAGVTLDERGGAGLLDHRHQTLGVLLELGVIKCVLRHDHRGDVAALQGIGEHVCAFRRIGHVGRDQHQAATFCCHIKTSISGCIRQDGETSARFHLGKPIDGDCKRINRPPCFLISTSILSPFRQFCSLASARVAWGKRFR
ncbi:hypothetical protein D9M72_476900 [compost metagenome]